MKKIIFILLMLAFSGAVTYAQCEKKLLLTSSKTEYLDASGTVQRTVDENSVIEISKDELIIIPGNETNKMTGPIKSTTCNWKTAFKEGKTVIKAAIADPGGEAKNVTITIEGKDGKITLLAEVEEMPERKIKVAIDKFVEKI